MNPFTAYDKPINKCENHRYPGTIALAQEIQKLYPTLRENGIYNCRPVAGTGTPSAHMQARGNDKSIDNATAKAQAEAAFWYLVANAEKFGIQGAILDHKIYGFGKRFVRQTHKDGNPHTDHLHWEQNIAGASLSAAEIKRRLAPPVNATQAEEEMFDTVTYKGAPGGAVWILVPTDKGVRKQGIPTTPLYNHLVSEGILSPKREIAEDAVVNFFKDVDA